MILISKIEFLQNEKKRNSTRNGISLVCNFLPFQIIMTNRIIRRGS